MKENGKCSRSERMASLLFTEKGGEFMKNGVSRSAQNRGRTPPQGCIIHGEVIACPHDIGSMGKQNCCLCFLGSPTTNDIVL